MALFNLKKKNKRKLPRTVQESIPYVQVYPNGVIETEPGVFTQAYALEDVNFKIAPDEEQVSIFHSYGMFINSFPTNARFQIVVQNKPADLRKFLETLRFEPQKDGLNRYRQEMNNIILDKVSAGRNNLSQTKYCIVSIEDNSVEHAMSVLNTISVDVDKALRRIMSGGRTRPMTLEERLHSLHDIYNQDGDSVFENVRNEDGTASFDLQKFYNTGATSKEAIAPSGISFKGNHFTVGETFGRSMYLERVPTWLSTDFMSDLSDIPYSLLLSTYYEPIDQARALKMVRDRIISLNASIADKEKKAGQSGYSATAISPELYRAQEQATSLMEDMVSRDQRLFYVTFTVTVFAKNLEELDDATRRVSTVANKYNAPIRKLVYQQEQGFNSCLPLCINELFTKRLLTTEASSVFLPYTSQELNQKGGLYYGVNQTSKSVIVYSRMSGHNYNGLIFGTSGSGKSFAAKSEMMSMLLRSDKHRVYIIDPENEYTPMVKAMGGEVINLAAGARTYVNPLDMDLEYSGDGDPLSMKSDYIVSMIEIMYGRGAVIEPKARSIIDRCVKNIYSGYLQHIQELRRSGKDITCDKSAMPTLSNLYNELKMQPELEAKEVADVLERYATGSMSLFAHRSNVETDAHIVSYNIQNLGTGMKDLGLFVCMNDIWNKMLENYKKGLWTMSYYDEFYLLLRSDSATNFLVEMWKRARKWNGVPTGIMQNTEDLLRTPNSRNIINNTDFILMLSLPKQDRDILGELLSVSEAQLEYINNAESGTGLLYTGKTILPFDNSYPRDSSLYALMSTSQTRDKIS